MSISNEALQKLVQEIENQAIQSQQQIINVRQQMSIKTREIRMLELTSKEVGALPSGTNIYEGVGKMFVFSPIVDVDKRLNTETTGLKTDIKNLEKRLQYLETTHKNSREHIDQIFSSGGRS